MSDQHPDFARRIEIPGDVLVTDLEFCVIALAGATRRTATRYEEEGLPYIFIAGCKYRPLKASLAWLASRIKQRNQPTPKRRNVAA